MDNDYDFSVVADMCADKANTSDANAEVEETGEMTAAELVLSKMNLLLMGQDKQSVSTLGKPMPP